jgi:hypothetical protein
MVSPTGCDPLGALCAAAVEENHVGILRVDFVERILIALMIVAIDAASEGDPMSARQEPLRLGQLYGVQENPAVDQGSRQRAVVDL